MKKILFILLFIFIVSINAATIEFFDENDFRNAAGEYDLVDFENYASGTVLSGNEYQNVGLTIVNNGGGVMKAYDPNTSWCNIYPWNTNGLYGDPGSTYHADFDFILDAPVRSGGLWLIDTHWNSYTIQFLTEDNQVIAQQDFGPAYSNLGASTPNGSGVMFFYGITTDMGIKKIRSIDSQYGEWIAIDNIHIGTSIPEPLNLALLILGMVSIFVCKKK